MTHEKQNKIVNKGNLYTEILRWAYPKKINGFSEKELFEKFGLGQDESLKNWYLSTFRGGRHNDDCIIGIFPDLKNNTHYFSLTAKGLSAAIDFLSLEEARENSIKSNKHSTRAFYVSVISLAIGVVAVGFQIQSNALTREDIELSASPVLNISLDKRDIPKKTNEANEDEVTIASGLLPVKDSVLKLILTNHSISTVEEVDMRMTLWKFFVDSKSHHLNVCPFGYVYKKDNSTFKVENTFVHNALDKNNVFSLQRNDEHPFTVDWSGFKKEKIDFKILLKIEVNFVKATGKTSHSYIKLYVLNSLDQVIDVGIAPEFGLMLNDKKNEKDIDGFKFPSAVYPFQEKEFLNYFENPTYRLDLQPNNCQEFILTKEQKVINY